jgi:hypothetical protein
MPPTPRWPRIATGRIYTPPSVCERGLFRGSHDASEACSPLRIRLRASRSRGAAFPCPTPKQPNILVIWGDDTASPPGRSDFASAAISRRVLCIHSRFPTRLQLLVSWLSNAEPFELPNATHLLRLQNPRGMAEALTSFYARHPLTA